MELNSNKMIFISFIILLIIHSIVAIHLSPHFGTSLGTTRTFELFISLDSLNLDCYSESYPSLVINHRFPGPAIRVVKDDIVRMKIFNSVQHYNNQSTSIHIHGIRQYGTNSADGVAGITQLAIKPGQEYTQEFQVIHQTGTFYYHAHVGVQDDTVQGPFIVYENEASLRAAISSDSTIPITEGGYRYDGERILQWSEYWHQSSYNRFAYYMSPDFRRDDGPDSILLNGKTVYDSNSTHGGCKGFSVINVEPNKVYRLRFIAGLTHRILGILIQDHNMTLIEIDGEYVQPYDIQYLEMTAGQRMSVLIKTGDYPDGTIFPIATSFRWRESQNGYTPNGYGYLRYSRKPNVPKKIMEKPVIANLPKNVFPKNDIPGWILHKIKPLVVTDLDKIILSGTASSTIKLNMVQQRESDRTLRFRNNGRLHQSWGTSSASLLDQVLSNSLGDVGALESFDGFSTAHQTYPIRYGQIVDMVFQNNFNPAGICVTHPWHIHGHSHYLIAEGAGDYQHATDKDIRTFHTPLLKDVSLSYPVSAPGTRGCGWTKVRIFTDNPGMWAVHCHFTLHMLQGKMVILEVAPEMINSTKLVF